MSLREEIEEFAHDCAGLEEALEDFAAAVRQHSALSNESAEAIVLGDRLARRAYNLTARLLNASQVDVRQEAVGRRISP